MKFPEKLNSFHYFLLEKLALLSVKEGKSFPDRKKNKTSNSKNW